MSNNRWASRRIDRLGSAIFAEVAAWKDETRRAGIDVIALDIGSPDQPPDEAVRAALAKAVMQPDLYRYPGTEGTAKFRQTAADWMHYRFGVELDPDAEVLALMGTQDGLAHLALAVTNPGDTVLLPDPGYPVYGAGLAVADVNGVPLPLRADNGFLPDFDAVPDEVWTRAKLMILNYPSNPLSAVADLAFFERAVDIARRRNLLLVHDNAYSEIAFDNYRPPSVLEVPGAADVALEFHSLSKSFHLAGARLGFAVGNRAALSALRALKNSIDFGVFVAVQEAGAVALDRDMQGRANPAAVLYERRRNVFVSGLQAAGWPVPLPKATMFVWAKLPDRWSSSRRFARALLTHAGVASIPGSAFGEQGEGYVRFALVEAEERLAEAAKRIGNFLK